MQDGHLYGSLIDILRFGAPPMLVALGMTLVIATGGIDLSVGAHRRDLGRDRVPVISRLDDQNSVAGVLVAIVAALALATALGIWNGMLVAVVGIQPIVATLILMVAGRGLAQLITSGQIITINSSPYDLHRQRLLARAAVRALRRRRRCTASARLVSRGRRSGMLIESVGGNAEASRLAGVRSREPDHPRRYAFSGLCSGIAGPDDQLERSRAPTATTPACWFELDAILAVVIGGTALRGGRYFLAGTLRRRAADPDADDDDLLDRHPARDHAALQGAGRHRSSASLQSPAFRAKVFGAGSGGRSGQTAAAGRTTPGAAGGGAGMSASTRRSTAARSRWPRRRCGTCRCSSRSPRRGDVRLRLAALPGLRDRAGVPQPVHRQLVPARRRASG